MNNESKDKADRSAFVEDYLNLCTQYGLVVDSDDELFINPIQPTLAISSGYNMKMYHKYMRSLV